MKCRKDAISQKVVGLESDLLSADITDITQLLQVPITSVIILHSSRQCLHGAAILRNHMLQR